MTCGAAAAPEPGWSLLAAAGHARSHDPDTWAHRLRRERDTLAAELAVWTHDYDPAPGGLVCRSCGSDPGTRVHMTPARIRGALAAGSGR